MLSFRSKFGPSKVNFFVRNSVKSAPLRIRAWNYRSLATSNKPPKEDVLSIKKLLLIGLVGTAIFVKAVHSLDKNQPKNSYTPKEYEQVLAGLKRRITLFEPGQVNVILVCSSTLEQVKEQLGNDNFIVLDPLTVVDQFRTTEGNRYQALLEKIWAESPNPSYINNLPNGMLISLIKTYMKENIKEGDKVVIINFPESMRDAIRFESDISVVSKVLIPRDFKDSEICKYYETVKKVEFI